MMNLTAYLDDLERRINPETEDALHAAWRTFADGHCADDVFTPARKPAPPTIPWPSMPINDAFEQPDCMVYQQLALLSDDLAQGRGALLGVRANYGTGIIPSMFGAELFFMDRALNTLPCTRPLPDGDASIQRILEEHRIDYRTGLAADVFRFADAYLQAVQHYPKLARYARPYNPDLQGPFPLADQLWGGDIYYAMADEDALFADALDFMTDVYIDFTRRWQALCPPIADGYSAEWGLLHKGGTMIRNDAAMNISGAMYERLVRPYDQRILDTFGGGVHFCGRGDHYVASVGSLARLGCVNLSQPELNDMEQIYQHTIDRGTPIVGMPEAEVVRAKRTGRPLRGLVHCGASIAAWSDR